MSRRNKSNVDISEKCEENQKEIIESLRALGSKFDTLSSRVAKCDKTGEEIKSSIEHCLKTCQESLKVSNQNGKEIIELKTELNHEKCLNAQLNSKVSKLEEKIIRIEAQSRRDNLLLDGIEETENEECAKKVREVFKNTMKVDNVDNMQIVRCHRLGEKRRGSNKPRTVIIKFHWFGDRTKVWQARKQLKGSDIYLNEDFPKEIQDKRRILRPILQRARTMEKQAFLNVDTLVIDGRKYTTDDLDKLPPELDPARIATNEVGDMLVFFGGQSPFSNFHKSNFIVKGVTYDCNERFYVRGKAVFAKDINAINAVMSAVTPQDIKRISHTLNSKINVKVWMDSEANTVMTEGVNAKFCQNPHLKNFLVNTGKKVLVEANPKDTHWSCGLSARDRTGILDMKNWPGKNVLGNILMETRDSLSK